MGEDTQLPRSGDQGATSEPSGWTVQKDLKHWQQETAADLSQEVTHLQAEKMRLIQEIADLQAHYHTLSGIRTQDSSPPPVKSMPLAFPGAPLTSPPKPASPSSLRMGLWLVLVSTVALSVHNVVVRLIIGNPSSFLGWTNFGGFIQPSLGNSLLILWMRMLVVVPLMAMIAGFIYPSVWQDIKRLVLDRDRRPLFNVMGSGAFLFLSQVLIYIAIAQVGPATAVTILFMYPIVTVPLAWWLFGDRPTRLRLVVMMTILLGVILTALPRLQPGVMASGGVVIAILSGIAFAFYLIFMQLGFKKLHPVPVSLVQFVTILFLTSLSLSLPLQLGVAVLPDKRPGFLVGALVLGTLTLVGYLTNNFGVRQMGAGRASIVASSGPVVTAVLAAILIHAQLLPVQVGGILLVTIGVTGLSFERMRSVTAAKK